MKTENNQKVKYESLSKGLGITGLVLGIVTLLVSFIPCFGLFAVFFGIIAIIISLIGLVIALKHDHEKSLIIGAIICSLLGCGIAYSQYAAMNSITNEIVKEANEIIDKSENKLIENETNPSKQNNISENKDAALVLEYMQNSKKDVSDENGLPLNYEYKINWGKSKSLGKTAVFSNKGDFRNSLFLELLVSEIEVVLSLNGKHSKTVKLISHIYELNELNPLAYSKIPTKYKKEEFVYTPALDDIGVQKEIIKDVTEPKFYQSLYKKTEHDKKVSNDWINATSELIKSSNILNIKTLEDFEKVESVSNSIEVSNKNLKKTESNESRGQYVKASERVLKESDVLGLSKFQLKIMRNEIFARYGHTFKSGGEMEAFFNKQDWYRNSAIDATNLLSEIEKENISFIKKYETATSTFLKISVDNLRVRTSPDLNAEKIENLPINTIVEFLNKKSDTKTKVTIEGEEINEFWYQIKTPSGNIGWIHGCCFEKQ